MRVSQTVSPSAFPQFFWHRDSEFSGVRLVPEPLATAGLWKRIIDPNLALRKSYPHFSTDGAFALYAMVWETLIQRSNNTSKKVFWMTQLLTFEQVASRLSVSKRSVQRWIREGRIETIRLSPGVVRVRDKALERFIDNQQREQRLSQGGRHG